jgi:hypothetical protein
MTENAGSKISYQYLHFAQTEDISLKSTLSGKSGVSLITARSLLTKKPLLFEKKDPPRSNHSLPPVQLD